MENDYPRPVEQLLQEEFGVAVDGIRKSPQINDAWRATGASRFIPQSISELLIEDFGETEWIVESLIPKEGIAALSGAPGAYKTWLIYHIAICIASGQSVFGKFKTVKAKTLIVDEENHKRLIQKRLKRLDAEGLDISLLVQQGIKLDQQNDRENLLQLAQEQEIQFIIFDSLVRLHNRDENDAMGMAKVAEALKEFTKRGITVLFTHHHRKQSIFGSKNPSQSMRGSSEILALVDSHIATDKHDDFLLLTQTKLRQEAELHPFKIQVRDENDNTYVEYLGEHNESETKIAEAKEGIVVYLKENGETTRQVLIEVLKGEVGQKSIGEALKQLKDTSEVKERTGERNKKFYSLPSESDVQQELM